MSENDEADLVRRRQGVEVVRLAIMAAGELDENWDRRVRDFAPRIAALLRPSGTTPGVLESAIWVLDAAVFKATFDHYEIEDKSQRVMVYVKSENSDDAEPLRTEPLWSQIGKAMAGRVKRELMKGDEILVYKHMDQFGEGKAAKNVRMLANFEILRRVRRPDDTVEQTPNSAPVQGTGGEPPTPPVPPSAADTAIDDAEAVHSAAASASPIDDTLGPDPGKGAGRPAGSTEEEALARRMTAVDEALRGLSNRQKIAVNALCRGEGIPNWASPDEDQLDKVLVIINRVARGE